MAEGFSGDQNVVFAYRDEKDRWRLRSGTMRISSGRLAGISFGGIELNSAAGMFAISGTIFVLGGLAGFPGATSFPIMKFTLEDGLFAKIDTEGHLTAQEIIESGFPIKGAPHMVAALAGKGQ